MRPLPSTIAERGSTERNVHPDALSPSRTPVAVLEFSSKKIAIRLFSPMIVPTRVKGGASCVLTTAVGGGGAGAAATAGGGGRRDEENNGRSRVAESFEIGMAHKGLPAAGGSAAGDPRIGRQFAGQARPGVLDLDRSPRDFVKSRTAHAFGVGGQTPGDGHGDRKARLCY